MKTGLDILLGAESEKKFLDKDIAANSDLLLKINDIKPNSSQPRSNFNKESISELANSIKEQGLLMPILVKLDDSDNSNEKYKIIAGERRWRACKSIGMKTIKVIVIKNTSKKTDDLSAIIENVQREDLSVLEEAVAYDNLIKNYRMKHSEIAKKTGKSRSYITNLIRLLGLEPEVKKLLNEGLISFGHARALLSSSNQATLAQKIINEKMNVRELEAYIKEGNGKTGSQEGISKSNIMRTKDANILDYEKYLSIKLGYKVEIKDKKGQGYLLVRYKNLEQLDAIVDLFNN